MIDIKQFPRIVIIQTAFIGDTVLSAYFAQKIKDLNPEAQIAFVCTPVSSDIISKIKCIDKVIEYDKRKVQKGIKGIKQIAVEVNKWNADLLFGLHRSMRSSILAKYINAKVKVGFSNSALSSVYNIKAKYYFNLHEIYRNFELLSSFGICTDSKATDVEINDFQPSECINQVLSELNNTEAILVAPGSVWATKKWLPEHFKRLVEILRNRGYRIIVSGSEKERELCEFVVGSTEAINLAGRASLSETMKIMSNCRLVICNDSAPTHIAMLAKTNVLTIFGATSPIFGFYPMGENSKSIINTKVDCSPCLIHGSNECPIGTFACMKGIKPEDVADKAIALIRKIGY